MSLLEDKVCILLEKALPYYTLIKQYYIIYNNQKLFFDFYIPELKVLVEVQGQQHFTFNKFHYASVNDFKKQKIRDKLKEEWCEENKYTLIAIKYDKITTLTVSELKTLIITK